MDKMAKRIFGSIPKTAGDLLHAIERHGDLQRWRVATAPAESEDETSRTRVVFWLDGTDVEDGYVAFEYGKLIVNLTRDYFFDLSRLHENDDYTWQRHIEEKNWCTQQHLALLDALCAVIPPALCYLRVENYRWRHAS